MQRKLIIVLSFLLPVLCLGVGGDHATGFHLDGSIENMGIIWVVPFAGILLSIAIFPLVLPEFWHHNFGKVSLFWASILIIPFLSLQDPVQVEVYFFLDFLVLLIL